MVFYFNGKKKSNNISPFSAILLIIGFGAIFYLLTSMESIEDFKEYAFQIILVLIVGIGYVVTIFQKKGEIHNYKISIEDSLFIMGDFRIPSNKLIIDRYNFNERLSRYHIRDVSGKMSIYSVFKDDLIEFCTKSFPEQTFNFQEEDSKRDGPYVSSFSKERSLHYNLETGQYKIIKDNEEISIQPEVFAYDGKYKS